MANSSMTYVVDNLVSEGYVEKLKTKKIKEVIMSS